MTQPSSIAKRLLLIALIAATFVVVQVVLAAPPQPSFNVVGPNFTTTCGLYTFTSTSTDPDDDIAQIDWDIAGTAMSGSSVSATFATPGQRTINMSATDTDAADGTVDTVPASPQTVSVGNPGPPNAAMASPTPNPAQPGAQVTFNGAASTATGSGSIVRYEWDLDGTAGYELDTGGTAQAQAQYATAGVHNVSLRVTDNCGQTDTVPGSVFVQNNPPTAAFTATPNPAAIGANVTFDGSGSSDAGGGIANYAWDFNGDGTFETNALADATTDHPFAAAGTYFVGLQVTDTNGATATVYHSVRINAAPVANFSYTPITPVINQPVTFNGSASSDADGTITAYAWDLDGNGSFEAVGATPAHTYTTPGTYNVKLRVTDSDNTQSVVLDRDVIVQATIPKPSFTFSPAHPLPGQAVTLRSTSAPSGASGATSLVATQWDFAYSPLVDFTLDGAGASIVTSFAAPGPHTVAVKVTETGGGFAIAAGTIPVNAPPQASFTVRPTKPREGNEVTFVSTATDPDGSLAKQEWDLNNDGKFERTGAVVTTSKLKAGVRSVKLRVTDQWGAAVTTTKPVKVAKPNLKLPQDLGTEVRYTRKSWGVGVVAFTVETPAKTSVAVSCKGKGCPRGTFRKKTGKKGKTFRFSQLNRNLYSGARINVLFAKKGRLTGWDVITVRPGKTSLHEGCKLSSKQQRWKRCPS
jgi:PKD repeat protein